MADGASVEEVYSRCVGNAATLYAAAAREASAADSVAALACTWGADVYAAQGVLWERIMIAASSPQRQFFRVGLAMLAGLSHLPDAARGATAADAVDAGRQALLDACDLDLRAEIAAAWSDLDVLAGLPAPDEAALAANVDHRLGGESPSTFVKRRRRESIEAMATAQGLRIKGEAVSAIEAAYESDLLALEGYLVESAEGLGDRHLWTVTIRWELAVRAMSDLRGLPESFVPAVALIRQTLAAALGDADGARLRAELQPS